MICCATCPGRAVREPFHDAFDRLLAGDASALDAWLPAGRQTRAGLAVYQNTVARARADALAALFPAVRTLVGEDWFRGAALIHAQTHPPRGPVLDEYGGDFPAWLEAFPPARDLPYLAPVARLDLAWSAAHRAADAPVLDLADFSAVNSTALLGLRAGLHPSVRVFWFDWTVPSIWLGSRPDASPGEPLSWEPTAEGLVIHRPGMEVRQRRISAPEYAVLKACSDGRTLGTAAVDLLRADPRSSPGPVLAGLVAQGVFTNLSPGP